MKRIKSFFNENKDIALFVALMVIFRSSFADINHVPTGSMQPTIVEGDRIIVNKLAYDLQFPLTNTKLLKLADPERGDIVIFESNVSNQRLVKRVIGVPGDVISMRNNTLTINGATLQYSKLPLGPASNTNYSALTSIFFELNEDLLGLNHSIRLNQHGSALDTFSSIVISSGYYLALGDNRDDSADSRVIGLIPRAEIIGRSERVLMSLNPKKFHLPRSTRFFKTL